jgi:hypothetical protein
VTPPLPKLIDNAGLQRELGIKRAAADAIMQRVPKVTIPGVKKTYVRRRDVERLLDENTQNIVARSPLRIVA